MTAENEPQSNTNSGNNKKRKRFLPHNKPMKKKGSYPLRPGVQGFFITCDGGREHQASREAINVIDSFYEELVHGKNTNVKLTELSTKPLNKKIKFTYSDDEDNDDDDSDGEDDKEEEDADDGKDENKSQTCESNNVENKNSIDNKSSPPKAKNVCGGDQTEKNNLEDDGKDDENQANEVEELLTKKKCIETCASKCIVQLKVEEKSIDKLIEEELKELGDKNKRRFLSLDSGCNGVVFVQMRKIQGDPSPKDIVQHMMTSTAATRKHMSRFILRVLPVEVACYASEEEISSAIAPLMEKYFPVDTQEPQKFAVLYEARANSGIDRMKIINSVAKSVPGPHKVDLSNPNKTIVVEIAKTVCLIGVVEKYKELSKYNLRQLTSSKQ